MKWTRGDPPVKDDEGDMPEELKGKTPGEIVAELKTLRAASAEHETAKTAHAQGTAALQKAEADLQAAQASIQVLEANRHSAAAAAATTGPTSILEDEDKAFNERLGPIVQNQLALAAQSAKFIGEQRVQQSPLHARLLTKFRGEVDKLFETVPLQFRQFPETYERVFQQVVGSHAGELITKDKSEFFIESGGGASPLSPSKKAELTEDEVKMARSLKISPEHFLAQKERMQVSPSGHVSFQAKE